MFARPAKSRFACRTVNLAVALMLVLLVLVTTSSCNSVKNHPAPQTDVVTPSTTAGSALTDSNLAFTHPFSQPVAHRRATFERSQISDALWTYPGSTTRQVLNDLRDGEGKPPP